MKCESRWAVFLSGRGSTAQAFFDLIGEIEIGLVLTDNENAFGIVRARRFGLPVLVLPRPIEWDKVHQQLIDRNIDSIFLLGFMRILPAEFVQKWQGRIWNLHPSLLPHYKGKDAFERSVEAGGPVGASIHEVVAELDAGPVFLQREIPHISHSLDDLRFRLAVTEQFLVREATVKINSRPRL